MDFEDAPHTFVFICVVLFTILLLYSVYSLTRLPQPEVQPHYAFTASTKVGHHAPTVLQFAARVPPGVDATPTIIQSFDIPRGDLRDR